MQRCTRNSCQPKHVNSKDLDHSISNYAYQNSVNLAKSAADRLRCSAKHQRLAVQVQPAEPSRFVLVTWWALTLRHLCCITCSHHDPRPHARLLWRIGFGGMLAGLQRKSAARVSLYCTFAPKSLLLLLLPLQWHTRSSQLARCAVHRRCYIRVFCHAGIHYL